MKKFIIICLSLSLIFTSCLFSGCNKSKKDKDITKLYTTYLSIADNSSKLKTIESSVNPSILQLEFDYSAQLKAKIFPTNSPSNTSAYPYIDHFYNKMLDDAIAPTLLYSQMLTNKNTTKTERIELFNLLDNLKSNYIALAKRLNELENGLHNSTSAEILIKLFNSYTALIDSAVNLSLNISNIYFNKIDKNSNPNYEKTNINKINLENIALNTQNRLSYYKALYVDIFMNTKIHNFNIGQRIVENPATFNISYTPYDTVKNTNHSNTINPNINNYRKELADLAINLHYIQNGIDSEYKIYRECLKKINYSEINERSSILDKSYKQIIDQFCFEGGLSYKSCYLINEILNICYNKNA